MSDSSLRKRVVTRDSAWKRCNNRLESEQEPKTQHDRTSDPFWVRHSIFCSWFISSLRFRVKIAPDHCWLMGRVSLLGEGKKQFQAKFLTRDGRDIMPTTRRVGTAQSKVLAAAGELQTCPLHVKLTTCICPTAHTTLVPKASVCKTFCGRKD